MASLAHRFMHRSLGNKFWEKGTGTAPWVALTSNHIAVKKGRAISVLCNYKVTYYN